MPDTGPGMTIWVSRLYVAKATKPSAASRRSIARRLQDFLLRPEASVIVVSAALILYFEVANPNFITADNIETLSQFVAAPVIIACGEIMLLICREIDLSVGQVFALAPFVMGFAQSAGLPIIAAMVLALAVSALIGLAIGLVTIRLSVPSFITTLGAFFLINGITLTISRGFPANVPVGTALAGFMGAWGYSEIVWAFAIVAVMHVVLRHTRWGLHTVATGGNIIAAAEAGIRIDRIKIGNFVLTSTLGGFTGLMEAFRVGSADPLAGGSNIMFLGVASGVIGGTAIAGGAGTIVGGLVGGIMLGVLQDGFTLQGINAFMFNIIIGAAILIAMVANIHLARWRTPGARGGAR
jgi:simple sugar transport system permease protein